MIKKITILGIIISCFSFFSPTKAINFHVQRSANKTFVKPTTLEELRNSDPLEIAKLDKYDSRDYEIVTPIKKQFLNICWSYATMAASETSILREGLFQSDTRNLDLSEKSHAFAALNNDPSLDPLNLTTGDVFNDDIDRGLYLNDSSLRLLNWGSPSFEPYIEGYPTYTKADFLLEDIIKVDYKDIDSIKKAIAQYGAVTVVYQLTDWMEDYYYYNGNINVFNGDNHAVTIVGWDDTIDKNLYKLPSSTNGGWIVKNSWGTAHAEGDGYFMMSYDTNIWDVFAYDFASVDKYDYNYHYDSYTLKEDYLFDNSKVAAIFPVRKSTLDKQEYLKAINVSVINSVIPKINDEATITAEIYTDVSAFEGDIYSSLNNPINNNEPVATVSRKINSEGSYTLELPQEIELKNNTYFSVVVKIENEANRYRVALSTEASSSINDLTFYEASNGKWFNCGNETSRQVARIKAFTKTKDREVSIDKDLSFTDIRIDNTQKIRYGNIPEKIDVQVKNNETLLKENVDYYLEQMEVEIKPDLVETTSDNGVVAIGKIKAVGKGEWSGEKTVSFPILVGFHDLSIIGEVASDNTIIMNVDGSKYTYADCFLPPNWNFLYEDLPLSLGENTGNYLVYKGADAICFRRSMYPVKVIKSGDVPSKININSAKVSLNTNNFIYNGKAHNPVVNVILNQEELKLNRDYIVSYENNINAGVATININGINKYEGNLKINFNIQKASNSITDFQIIDGKPVANAKFGEIIFKYFKDESCTNEIEKPTNPGTYYVVAFVEGTSNYESVESNPLKFIIEESEIPVDPEKPEIPDIPPQDEDIENSNKTGLIVGISVGGGLAAIILAITIVILIKKRK